MYLLVKFGDHRSYKNWNINSYINSYIDTLKKGELITSAILLDFENQEYEIPGTAGRKTKKRKWKRIQAIAKRYAVQENAKNVA